ncbi:universal stress protein [Salinarchaeum sp. IM2453]|uniref:universal stress protein n=1 Tax=Salinarchaeum sp. IM2453 TaxID=2862870 RepID=UPI001C82A22B|nr:universal stress protein [Salinarchaeum sp. IM2453]QZA88551.1 universal stress protein [Salinarchaeum sp. IM2453]
MVDILVPVEEEENQITNIKNTLLGLPFNPEITNLHLLNVFEEFEVESDQWSTINSEEFYEKEFPQPIASLADELQHKGYSLELYRRHGDPVDTIIQLSNEITANMIVVGGRKRSPVGKALFGSVAQSVILQTDIPVLIAESTN